MYLHGAYKTKQGVNHELYISVLLYRYTYTDRGVTQLCLNQHND